MARNITFKIITQAQTNALKDLNKELKEVRDTLNSLTKGQRKTIDKALGLDKAAADAKDALVEIRSLSKEVVKAGKEAKKASGGVKELTGEALEAAEAMKKKATAEKEANKETRKTEKANERAAKSEEEKADALLKAQKAYSTLSNSMGDYEKTARRLRKSVRDQESAFGDLEKRLEKHLPTAMRDGSRDVETFLTDLRQLTRETGAVDRAMQGMKGFPERVQRSQEKYEKAVQDTTEAQRELMNVLNQPNPSLDDVQRAQRVYDKSVDTFKDAQKEIESLNEDYKKLGTVVSNAENRVAKLNTALKNADVAEAVGPRDIQRIETLEDSLKSVSNAMKAFGTDGVQAFDKFYGKFKQLGGRQTQLETTVEFLARLRKELTGIERFKASEVLKDIGNPRAAINATTDALRKQIQEQMNMVAATNKIISANNRWEAAEEAKAAALNTGRRALEHQKRIEQMYAGSVSDAKSARSTLDTRGLQLQKQELDILRQREEILRRIAATRIERDTAPSRNTEQYVRAVTTLRQYSQALDQNRAAQSANQQNMRENAAGFALANAAVERLEDSYGTMRAEFVALRNVTNKNPFQQVIEGLQDMNKFAMQASNAFSGKLRSGITAATGAAKSFIGSAGSMFSGLQRALQSVSNSFVDFGNRVARSMGQARASMMEFYAAGYSLLTIGSQMQQMGNQVFRGMSQGLNTFMEYERARTQAGVAGAVPYDAQGNQITNMGPAEEYRIDSKIIDDMIFDLQRGNATPEWLGGGPGGAKIPVTFDAKELANGLYYYSSAIGAPITEQNQAEVSAAVSTIMQMADITNTGIETATKGVLNVMMEFGYDPRDIGSTDKATRQEAARITAETTAKMGYLANVSSMEVSDIVETFKMVGPQAHFLSPGAIQPDGTRTPGAGLDETFMLAFLASEVGLRGGNVGRGINQAFTSLLDPTEKMLEVAGEHFGDGAKMSVDEFNALFKDENGALKGGIRGFLKTLGTVAPTVQAEMLAQLLTSNATRAMMGPVLGSDGFDADAFLAGIDENPLKWMEAAIAESANTISTWFAFMTNGWFQFQNAIVGSVKGPLMGAFRTVGNVLFDFAEEIKMDPAIGRVIAGIVTAFAALASVLGTVAIAAGGILLVGRSLAMFGGVIGGVLRMVAFAGATLFALVPALLAIGIAVAGVRALWQNNFMGMKEAFENFTDGMTIESFSDNFVKGLLNITKAVGTLINEFTTGILGGKGNTENLFAFMESILGPKMGRAVIGGLLALRNALGPTRMAINDFFSGIGQGSASLADLGLAVQGFLEQIFMGSQREETTTAQNRIGEMLGITNLSGQLASAAALVGTFIGSLIGYAQQLGALWSSIGQQIYSNIARALGGVNANNVFGTLGTVAAGVAQGIALAFTVILGSIEVVTDRIANFAEGLRAAGGAGKEVLGFTMTFRGALQALGATIGVVLGTRLALAFGPFMGIISRVIPMLSLLGAGFVGIAGRIAVMAGMLAVSTAAFIAHSGVIAANAVVQAALAASKTALGIATTASATAATGEAAAQGGLTGVMSLLGGLVALITMQKLAFAAALQAAGASAGVAATFYALLSATMIAVAAGAMIAIIAFVALAAILSAVAIGAVIMVTATQGIGAGFSALSSVLSGVWQGMQLGIAIITTLITVIMAAVGAIGNLVGAGDAFQSIGFAIGLAISGIVIATVVLIGALATLAVAFIAAWVAGLTPVGLVLLAFAAIGVAAFLFRDQLHEMGQGIKSFFSSLADGIEMAWAHIVDSVGGALARMTNNALDNLQRLTSLYPDFMPGGTGELGWRATVPTEVADLKATRRTEQYVQNHNEMLVEGARSVEESNSMLMSALAAVGLDDEIKQYAVKLNIDVDNMGAGDLKDIFSEMMKVPEMADMVNNTEFDYSMFGPSGESYQAALDGFKVYEDALERFQGNHQKAADFLKANDIDYNPVDPGSYEEWDKSQEAAMTTAEKLAEAAAAIGMSIDDINAAFSSLKGMTAEDFLNAQSPTGTSMGGMIAGKYGEQILKNIPEGTAPWMNPTELLYDAAGTGVNLAAPVGGQNMHKALSPYLEIVAQQTGLSVEELRVDIPKFHAPEEFVGVASADIALGISEGLSKDQYIALDLLGQNAGVEGYENGMDWAEVTDYAVGQAVQGHDWNFADFIAASWDMSLADANAYLAANNIDPNVINSGMMEATKIATLSGNGAFDVMTTEMYDYLAQATNQFTSDVITMTESEWAAIPPAYKAIMSNMGITTVISDFIPASALAGARAKVAELGEIVQSLPTHIAAGMEGIANYQMEGSPHSWLKVDEFTTASGELMVVLQDLDGTQVHIPAADYEPFVGSLDIAKQAAENFRTYVEDWQQSQGGIEYGYQDTINEDFLLPSMVGDSGKTGPSNVTGLNALGLPEHVDIKVRVETASIETAKSTVEEIVTTATNGGKDIVLKINAQTSNLSESAKALETMKEAMTKIGATPTILSITANTSNLSETASALKTMKEAMEGISTTPTILSVSANTSNLSETAAALKTMKDAMSSLSTEPVVISISASTSNLTEAASALDSIRQSIANIPVDATVTIAANTTNLSEAAASLDTIHKAVGALVGDTQGIVLTVTTDADLGGIGNNLQKIADAKNVLGESYTYTITVNAEGLGSTAVYVRSLADSMTTLMSAGSFAALDIEVTITGHDVVQPIIDTMRQKLGEIESDWQATVSQTGAPEVGTAIDTLTGQMRMYAVTWLASITQQGIAGVGQAISGLIALLQQVAKTWTVVVNVNVNRASLDGLLGDLNSLPSSKSVNITTTTTNVTNNITRSSVQNIMTGGTVGSAGMLGRSHDPRAIVGRATGGAVTAGEYTLVGELGPELVKLPTGSFVHTARETSSMFKRQLAAQQSFTAMPVPQQSYSPPTFGRGAVVEPATGQGNRGGDTHIHIAELNINDRKASEHFFSELDRRAGRKTQLARRGMVPTDDQRPW